MSFTRVLTGSAEKPKKSQEESHFCSTIGCSYVTLLTTCLAKKTMFKVSNRSTRKICLLISKTALKTSKRRHLTTSYLPEVTVQNHVQTVFPRIYTNLQSKVCFHFCFQVRRPVISTIVNLFMSFYEKSLPKYFFLFLKKQPPKQTHVSIFYLIFKGPAFQYHKV